MNHKKPTRAARALLAGLMAAAALPAAHAGFTNGSFADPVDTGWNPHGYQRRYLTPGFVKNTALTPIVPQTFADLGLQNMDTGAYTSQSATRQGAGSATNTGSNLSWPSGNALRVHSDTTGNNTKASSVHQEITLAAADRDPATGKFHLRFLGAPVLENYASHNGTNQAYFFIEVVKDDGTPNAKVLYTTYNFANQPSVVFHATGSYQYTDWVNFDIALDTTGPNAVAENDKVTLRVVAAGCGDTAHAGAFYMREVRTGANAVSQADSIWVTASAEPEVRKYVNADGSTTIEYTYTYKNIGTNAVSGVKVEPALPVTSDGKRTVFDSIGVPTVGTTKSCTAPQGAEPASVDTPWSASCAIGDLAPGEEGTFTMKVRVPAGTTGDAVNNGTYPISATDIDPQSGQMVQTKLYADMVPDTTNVPATLGLNQPVPPTASFSCKNEGATQASAATCAMAGLPTGVTTGQCKIKDINGANETNWTGPAAVPVGATVTCPLTGTPTDEADVGVPKTTTATGNAGNDGNPGNNAAPKQVTVGGPHVTINLGGLPKGVVGQPYKGSFTCTSDGAIDATNARCGVTGLPDGVTVGQCTIDTATPAANWAPGETIPVGKVVTCPVAGTPAKTSGPVTGTAGSGSFPDDVQTVPAGDVAGPAPAGAQAIPTLSEWGLILLSALMGLFMARRRQRG